MHGKLHRNLVLYNGRPASGARYRQIAVVEGRNNFEVRIFEGSVVQLDPKFIAESSDAEVHFRPTLADATKDAETEFNTSVHSGEWEPYNPLMG